MTSPLRSSLLVLLLPVLAVAADKTDTFTEPEQAGPDFAVQGEYVGDNCGAQVISLGAGKFRVVGWTPGLPGTAADVEKHVEIEGMRVADKIAFEQQGWKAAIVGDELTATNDEGRTWKLRKTDRKSPTLGAKPPSGATVL